MQNKTDWDLVFKNAHLHSFPTAGISIATVLTKEYSKEIFDAAKKYGYEVINKNSAQFSFINPLLKGEKNVKDGTI